jgi:hypothetical protein
MAGDTSHNGALLLRKLGEDSFKPQYNTQPELLLVQRANEPGREIPATEERF